MEKSKLIFDSWQIVVDYGKNCPTITELSVTLRSDFTLNR
jgi:hypothetical protein